MKIQGGVSELAIYVNERIKCERSWVVIIPLLAEFIHLGLGE